MKRKIATILIVLCLLHSGCRNETNHQTVDDSGVKSAFDNYKSSILSQQGSNAVKHVSLSTIEYYGHMMETALTGKEEEVKSLSTIDKMMVILLRHKMKPKLLANMTAEELFIYTVDSGWIGKESVINSDIGEIHESNDKATAVFMNHGEKTPYNYTFIKEKGKWKLDLTAVMPISDQAFKQVVKSSNLDENEYIVKIIESLSGKKLSEDIWQPLIRE